MKSFTLRRTIFVILINLFAISSAVSEEAQSFRIKKQACERVAHGEYDIGTGNCLCHSEPVYGRPQPPALVVNPPETVCDTATKMAEYMSALEDRPVSVLNRVLRSLRRSDAVGSGEAHRSCDHKRDPEDIRIPYAWHLLATGADLMRELPEIQRANYENSVLGVIDDGLATRGNPLAGPKLEGSSIHANGPHGTAVAGVAASKDFGVNPSVPVKGFAASLIQGFLSRTLSGDDIYKQIQEAKRDAQVKVVNMSFTTVESPAAIREMSDLLRSGKWLVIPVSNENSINSPLAHNLRQASQNPCVFAVGGTSYFSAPSNFSNRGDFFKLHAPASAIRSLDARFSRTGNASLLTHGTSYSSPQLGSLLSTLHALNPRLSCEQAQALLKVTAIPRGESESELLSMNALLAAQTLIQATSCLSERGTGWQSCFDQALSQIERKALSDFQALNLTAGSCQEQDTLYESLRKAYFLTKGNLQVALQLHKYLQAQRGAIAVDRMIFPARGRELLLLQSFPRRLHFNPASYTSRNYIAQENHQKDYRAALSFFEPKQAPAIASQAPPPVSGPYQALRTLNPTLQNVDEFVRACGDELSRARAEGRGCVNYLNAAPMVFRLEASRKVLRQFSVIQNSEMVSVANQLMVDSVHGNIAAREIASEIHRKVLLGIQNYRSFKEFDSLFHQLQRLQHLSPEDRVRVYQAFSQKFREFRMAPEAESHYQDLYARANDAEKQRLRGLLAEQVDKAMIDLLSSVDPIYLEREMRNHPELNDSLYLSYLLSGRPSGRRFIESGQFVLEHRRFQYGFGNFESYFSALDSYLVVSPWITPSQLQDRRGDRGFGDTSSRHFTLPLLNQVPGYGDRLYSFLFEGPQNRFRLFFPFLDQSSEVIVKWIERLSGTPEEKAQKAQRILNAYIRAEGQTLATISENGPKNYRASVLVQILDELSDRGFSFAQTLREQIETRVQTEPALQNARRALLRERALAANSASQAVESYAGESSSPLDALLDLPLENIESNPVILRQIQREIISDGHVAWTSAEKVLGKLSWANEVDEGLELVKILLPHLGGMFERRPDRDESVVRRLSPRMAILAQQSSGLFESVMNQLRALGRGQMTMEKAKLLAGLFADLNQSERTRLALNDGSWTDVYSRMAQVFSSPRFFDFNIFYYPRMIPHGLLLALSKWIPNQQLFVRSSLQQIDGNREPGGGWVYVAAGANVDSLKVIDGILAGFYEIVSPDTMATLDPVLNGERDREKRIVFAARKFKYGLEAFALNNDLSNAENLNALLAIARKHPFLANDVYRAINLSRGAIRAM